MAIVLILLSFSIICFLSTAYGYDGLDPNGNVTIKWDVMQDNGDTQDVRISIFNYQLFRHVEHPGWKLSWAWTGDEVIWDMLGAEATEQGNCSRFKGKQLPHSCEKEPVIIDLLPGAPYNKQVANCCKGGVLTSMAQDPDKYMSAFQMNIGVPPNSTLSSMAENFTFGVPGYTCGPPIEVPSSSFIVDNGRRRTRALSTWDVSCSYSQFLSSPTPKCCIAFSAFYNDTIVPCPKCSCGCQGQPGGKCVNNTEELPQVLQLPQSESQPQPILQCTRHMCPIKVHWHVKLSYTQYWRVKITITNLNYARNYSQWNLVVLHPNLEKVTRVFSFNYKSLKQHGNINDTGMFYGIQYYNDILLQSGNNGSVQTEMLLNKDPRSFTFREGWAFPRKISFNGDECVMPQPDDYPRLPNSGQFGEPPPMSRLVLLYLLSFAVML